MIRSLVIWVPDWPVIALTREGDEPLDTSQPIAVFDKGAVLACSPAARAETVRVGQRRRDAQARCPRLIVVDADPVRDHRVFAPLVTEIEARAPGVQLRAPGLCILRARGPARYYGGERSAAQALLAAFAEAGIGDVRMGIADGPFAAEVAARWGTQGAFDIRIVPEGETSSFLAPLPVTVLDEVTGESVAGLFAKLGIQSLGAVADLSRERLVERFGVRGQRLHALVAGEDRSPVTPREPPPELHREVAFEPPLEHAEQVAFGMRIAAEEFVFALGAADLVCTELRVVIAGDRAQRSERVWRHPGSFDAAAIVDRVRWQLAEGALSSAVSLVRIEPEGVDPAAHHVRALFGSGPEERVHHALSRVQAMLGHRGVVTPVIGGGRWLTERQVLIPWGDRPEAIADVSRPWPGSLPDPLPSTVFERALPVSVIDAEGDMVAVDARGELTADPELLITAGGKSRPIESWAGPWTVDERGWDPTRARHAHRFQVVDVTQTAWLLVCENGEWHAEGRYD